jgi:hypothetical protein
LPNNSNEFKLNLQFVTPRGNAGLTTFRQPGDKGITRGREMSEIKIVINGEAELDVAMSALEAMWAAGATRISLERVAPVIVSVTTEIPATTKANTATPEMKRRYRGDLICVESFWDEIKQQAELNVIAAREIDICGNLLIEWHRERVDALLSRIIFAKTQCAVRSRIGKWHFHL